MKRRDLIKLLENNGRKFDRNGGNHDVYYKDGKKEMIERHTEIPEKLANRIIKRNNLKQ